MPDANGNWYPWEPDFGNPPGVVNPIIPFIPGVSGTGVAPIGSGIPYASPTPSQFQTPTDLINAGLIPAGPTLNATGPAVTLVGGGSLEPGSTPAWGTNEQIATAYNHPHTVIDTHLLSPDTIAAINRGQILNVSTSTSKEGSYADQFFGPGGPIQDIQKIGQSIQNVINDVIPSVIRNNPITEAFSHPIQQLGRGTADVLKAPAKSNLSDFVSFGNPLGALLASDIAHPMDVPAQAGILGAAAAAPYAASSLPYVGSALASAAGSVGSALATAGAAVGSTIASGASAIAGAAKTLWNQIPGLPGLPGLPGIPGIAGLPGLPKGSDLLNRLLHNQNQPMAAPPQQPADAQQTTPSSGLPIWALAAGAVVALAVLMFSFYRKR